MLKKIQCQICNKYYNKLSSHVQISHNMPYKEYYDKYLKKEGEGICPICGKKTNFYRNKYTQTCSYACATQLRNNNKQHELNVQYGAGLVEDGIFGPATKGALENVIVTYGARPPKSK